jgi:hypothetical protein
MPLERFEDACKCYCENVNKGKVLLRPAMKA